ncbi:MAG: hypothetical protein JWL76_405 [Thermoleophilia bacterium]|nr:hypothetical protein [Thermoleophilia bacterium]
MRLPAHGVPMFEGIDDLRRLVQAPARVLDDAEQAHVSSAIDELYNVEPSMPFGYRSLDLGAALATVDRTGAEHARHSEQVRAAWDLRFSIDPTDQAAIGARLAALLDGPAAVLDTQRGVAELRTLLHLSTDEREVPVALGIMTHDKLDDAIRHKLAGALERWGTSGDAGAEFIDRWKLVRDPARIESWHAALDDAARGRRDLPANATIELVLAPVSNFGARSQDQRMRLLDGLASAGGGPVTTARSRTSDVRSFAGLNDRDVAQHVSRQVGRALRDESPLPVGIQTHDILTSWHYRRAPFAQRVALMEQHARTNSRPLFEEFQDMRDRLDPAGTEVARRQVERILGESSRSGTALPTWIDAGDIVTAQVTERQKARLLSAWRGEQWSATPDGAASRLVEARLRLDGERMGGGVEGALTLRASTLDMIDRNLHRIARDVDDGYDGHPDYAEVGRVESNLKLLADFQTAANAHAAPVQAPESAAVTW